MIVYCRFPSNPTAPLLKKIMNLSQLNAKTILRSWNLSWTSCAAIRRFLSQVHSAHQFTADVAITSYLIDLNFGCSIMFLKLTSGGVPQEFWAQRPTTQVTMMNDTNILSIKSQLNFEAREWEHRCFTVKCRYRFLRLSEISETTPFETTLIPLQLRLSSRIVHIVSLKSRSNFERLFSEKQHKNFLSFACYLIIALNRCLTKREFVRVWRLGLKSVQVNIWKAVNFNKNQVRTQWEMVEDLEISERLWNFKRVDICDLPIRNFLDLRLFGIRLAIDWPIEWP